MDIRKEKEYMYNMMRDVSAERRRLTDIYYELLKRINELSKLEEVGVTDLSIEGYLDLGNKINAKLIKANQEREALTIFSDSRKEVEQQTEEETRENITPKTVVPSVELDSLKQFDNKFKPKVTEKKVKKHISTKKAHSYIKDVLIEKGTPMETKDLYARIIEKYSIDEEDFKYRNLVQNVLPRVSSLDSKLQKVGRSTFQYVL